MAINATDHFSRHTRFWADNRFVYPVISRRSRGLSIGINLNPDARCTFDCVYCSAKCEPATEERVEPAVVRAELEEMLDSVVSGEIWRTPPFASVPEPLRRLNDVALSGNGEPTSSPHFPAACAMAVELLERHGLDAKVVVITNSTLLHVPRVLEALQKLGPRGEVWAKLDAGTEELYRRINRSGVPLSRVLENLRLAGTVRPLVIQSMFLSLEGRAPTEPEITAWLDRLQELVSAGCQIDHVQVYTVARATAEAGVSALPSRELDAIAARVRQLGLAAEVFSGSAA